MKRVLWVIVVVLTGCSSAPIRFSDQSYPAGVADPGVNSTGPTFADFDNDGDVDLYVSTEAQLPGQGSRLYRNDGKGRFVDVAPELGVDNGKTGLARGAAWGDIDNDGDQDVFLPTADQASRLILSRLAETGAATFEDITLSSGVGDKLGARGCTMADFDNDGWLDIYVNNGGLSDTLVNDVLDLPPSVQFYIAWEPALNKLYRNRGDLSFADVTPGSGAEGLGIGSGVGWADVNDDGFPDLFVANRTYYSQGRQVGEPGQNRLYVNRGNGNRWIRVVLQGTAGNRDGYGARVKVVAGDLVQTREHTSAHGYNSGNDPRLLFGLGSRRGVDRIEVTWPGGKTQVLPGVPSGTTLRIVEP